MNPGSLSTSMIKVFVTIVNGFQYKTIVTKISFIDLTGVLSPVRCEFLNTCSALLLIDYLKKKKKLFITSHQIVVSAMTD